MKHRYFVLFLSILVVVLYSACEKKDGATSTATPVVDSTKNTDSIKQVSTQKNPRSDPNIFYYTGLLTSSLLDGPNIGVPGIYDTDNNFTFYTTHTTPDSIKFTSLGSLIDASSGSGLDVVSAQFKINDSNSYYYLIYDGYPNYAYYYSFKISNGILSVSWRYPRDVPGTCDQGCCTGYFTGVKQ